MNKDARYFGNGHFFFVKIVKIKEKIKCNTFFRSDKLKIYILIVHDNLQKFMKVKKKEE